ncbi:ester hydrolase C11orf54 homolog [Clavelina lepadiformis]|uniref:DUF1907 domain-containing protein n=1 Tax=Clavelina lepadiformis TaxID=159417 RepID=A0ABP0F8R2_CLALP
MAKKGDASRDMAIESRVLHIPPLQELADTIAGGLQDNYAESSCTVVDCPDLSKDPYGLAAPGLCGKTRLVDVGGVPYLCPVSQYMERVYDLENVSNQVNLPGCFILGAGAGSKHAVGVNCEMMPNIRCAGGQHERQNLVHISKVIPEDGSHVLEAYESQHNDITEFVLLANLFCSEGKLGKVLHVRAKCRKGDKDLVECMKGAIRKHYGPNRAVGMGGTFLVKQGSIKIHVMPDFSETPLTCDEEVTDWLKFYEVSAPFVCLSTFITEDLGLDLRVTHTHGYNKAGGTGGHYHTDVTPEEIEYVGYFVPAESVYRLDRPSLSNLIGRPESQGH